MQPSLPVGARGIMCADYFRLTCHFSDRDPFVEEQIDLAGEQGTVSVSDLYWSPGTADKDKVDPTDAPTFVKMCGTWDYSVKRTRIVFPELATLRGKINSVTMKSRQMRGYASLQQSFDPGTVLFMGMRLTPVYVPFGNDANDPYYCPYSRLDYRFLINKEGWNTFPQTVVGATKPTWNSLVTRSGSAPYPEFDPYEEGNLNILLFNPS